jgi:hypothetical protein
MGRHHAGDRLASPTTCTPEHVMIRPIRLARAPLACALAVLAACGGRDETAARAGDTLSLRVDSAGGSSTAVGGSLADASTVAQIDSVATAANNGLTSLSPAVAVPLIRSLEEKLDASEDAALDDIADELEKLREELDGSKIEPPEIANILERLGPKVQQVAARGGAAQGSLETIARALTAAVPTLRGGNR